MKNIQVPLKSHKNDGTLHEDQYTFPIIPRSPPLKVRHVAEKSCRENQNTLFMFKSFFSKIVPFMRQCGEM